MMEKARRDEFFLGHWLDDFARRKGFDDNALAGHLRCPLDRLPQLFLCRCPEGDDPQFAQQVRTIAQYAPCDETQLLLALREVVAIAKLSGNAPSQASSILLAARDRQDKDIPAPENDKPQSGTEAP
jgi:hypothetical protein